MASKRSESVDLESSGWRNWSDSNVTSRAKLMHLRAGIRAVSIMRIFVVLALLLSVSLTILAIFFIFFWLPNLREAGAMPDIRPPVPQTMVITKPDFYLLEPQDVDLLASVLPHVKNYVATLSSGFTAEHRDTWAEEVQTMLTSLIYNETKSNPSKKERNQNLLQTIVLNTFQYVRTSMQYKNAVNAVDHAAEAAKETSLALNYKDTSPPSPRGKFAMGIREKITVTEARQKFRELYTPEQVAHIQRIQALRARGQEQFKQFLDKERYVAHREYVAPENADSEDDSPRLMQKSYLIDEFNFLQPNFDPEDPRQQQLMKRRDKVQLFMVTRWFAKENELMQVRLRTLEAVTAKRSAQTQK